MKNFSFYWNWLARVAKLSGVQRKAVVKSATSPSQSSINGKTAIFAILATAAVLLVPQTTGPLMQSAEMPELPDLPDPGPVPEPVFPPVPPGTFTCFEYYEGMRQMLENGQANFYQAIERTYNAKCKPFNDKIDELVDEIDNHLDQILEKTKLKEALYQLLYPNVVNNPQIKKLEGDIQGPKDSIEALRVQISELFDDLGKIADWRKKIIKWANEKHRKENEALDAHYQDCLDNERDDD